MYGRELLVGRYELRGVLGRGGMAEVHDGWDTRLDRAVAVKLLYPAFNAEPDVRRRFEDEARAAARLNHPNIVAVYDSGEHAGRPFIVMERLPGQTLADVIARGPMPQPQVRRMLDEVLGALATAHAAGVLHRDIKPGNILVARDAMKVADFGIAKTAGAAHTATGQIVGTMAYMSPERVAGAPASVADDLYAVAAMGFEALTGARPFPQQNPAALVQAIMAGPPVPLRAVQPDVDPVLASVIDRAMARDPGARFASAEQMRSALAGSRPATMVLAAPVAPSATYVVARRGRRRPLSPARKFVLAAAAFVGLIVTLLAVALDPSSTTQPPQPVSTSTTVPPPVSVAPPPPSPSPSAVPVIEQPTKPKKAEPGHGGGPGRGNKKHD